MNLLTIEETAEALKVSAYTLARWRVLKKGPAFVKVGRAVRYSRESLEAWLKKKTVSAG